MSNINEPNENPSIFSQFTSKAADFAVNRAHTLFSEVKELTLNVKKLFSELGEQFKNIGNLASLRGRATVNDTEQHYSSISVDSEEEGGTGFSPIMVEIPHRGAEPPAPLRSVSNTISEFTRKYLTNQGGSQLGEITELASGSFKKTYKIVVPTKKDAALIEQLKKQNAALIEQLKKQSESQSESVDAKAVTEELARLKEQSESIKEFVDSNVETAELVLIETKEEASKQIIESEKKGLELMQKLKKGHVPKTLGTIVVNGRQLTVQQFANGGTLKDAAPKLNEKQIEKVSEDFLDIVYSMNVEAGIIHRDIKADNVFIVNTEHEPKVLIGDFGLAKGVEDPEPLEGKINMTWGPPEYGLGNFEYEFKKTPHTDIYMTGLMLWQLKTGNLKSTDLPHMQAQDKGKRLLLKSQMNLNPEVWKKVSLEDQLLLKSMLHPDPEKRITHEELKELRGRLTYIKQIPQDDPLRTKFDEELKRLIGINKQSTEEFIEKEVKPHVEGTA